MKEKHVSETEIQQYALRKSDCPIAVTEHLLHCQKCQAEVEVYQLLFAQIQQITNPVFEFDIANLVLPKLPQKQNYSFDKYLISILSGIGILLLSVLIFAVNCYFPMVFSSVSFIQISLIISSTLIVSVFIYFDMKRNYYRHMNLS